MPGFSPPSTKPFLNQYNKAHAIKQIAIFCMAAMQLLRDLGQKPQVILTNDWSAGFAAAYRNIGLYGDAFRVG
jgi:glycogen synthase